MITSSDDFFKNFDVSNNIEYLAELLVGSDEKLKISIHVDPDPNREGDEYFKIYNSPNFHKANKIARIKFREPVYVIHQNTNGKINWYLNSHDKKKLISFLSSKNSKKQKLTNWKFAITAFNTALDLKSEKDKKFLPLDLKMPDYQKLVKIE